jgi:hypothetical protein
MWRSIAVALCALIAGGPGASRSIAAKEKTSVAIPNGAQIGVVNLLDPEVTHYHAARDSHASFLKIRTVNWPVDEMLRDALQGEASKLGLALVPVLPSGSLLRAREQCFVDVPLAKGLPRSCSPALIETASAAHVDYLILLAPGLNNADHAGGDRLQGLGDNLRGWGFFTRERSQEKPLLFDETELLLVSVSQGSPTLRARQWGGIYSVRWQAYTPREDPKNLPQEQLDQMRPLFAAMLTKQAEGLMAQVHTGE